MQAAASKDDGPVLLSGLSGGVLRLTMNRPGSRNPLSEAMLASLQSALDDAAGNDDVRAIVIASEGPGFCGGHDLKQMTARRSDEDGGRQYFADLFGGMFGGAGRQQRTRPQASLDLHAALNLTLEELYNAKPVELYVRHPNTGEERQLRVKVPSHLRDGESFRLKGQGAKQGDRTGDLYVEIRLVPHPQCEVRGNDVHVRLPVTPWEAVLGAKIEVNTLGGVVNLTVPPRSQSGRSLRLPKRGLPGPQPGNQIVTLDVQVPTDLDSESLAHFEALAKSCNFDPRSKHQRERYEARRS